MRYYRSIIPILAAVCLVGTARPDQVNAQRQQAALIEAQKAKAAAGRVDSIAIGAVTTDTSLAFPYTAFGLGLLHAAVERFSPDSNRILSPVGAGQALGVALLGARDSTRLAIAHALGLGRLSADSLASRNHWLNAHFDSRRDLVLKVANAVWVDTSATLNPAFERTVQQAYASSVRTMPLTSFPIVSALNRWADSTTAGRIQQVISKPFKDLTKVVLTNAVYLKSRWLTPFDSNDTKPRPFTLRSGQQLMVPMMERTDGFAYRRGEHFQTVRLPYKDGLTALYVVLPDSGSSALTTLDYIRRTEWPFPNPISETRKVHLVLPKMHVEQKTDLVDPLIALGMGIAFNRDRANFGNLLKQSSERLFISEAQQNTYFDVDESGTEAAAVTMIVGEQQSAPRITEFVADRPFLLVLREEKTGALLFVGYIARPS